MNDDQNRESRGRLEVRIVALLLGEASGFETAEIEEGMQKNPELAAFHAEMRLTIGLTREASKQFQTATQPAAEQPKLSTNRREALLAKFKQGKVLASAVPWLKRRQRKWLVPASLAAGIIVLVTLLSTSRRGRPSISTTLNLTDARMMEDAILERSQLSGQISAEKARAGNTASHRGTPWATVYTTPSPP